jgi:hypothetical protein
VPLTLLATTTVEVAFQNTGIVFATSIRWLPVNTLTNGNILIRKGDSLLLTAAPVGATNGTVTIAVNGTNYQTSVESPVEFEFGAAGTYTVMGTYTPVEGQMQSGSFSVQVVSSAFPTNVPVAWAGKARNWDCQQINMTHAVIEVDERLGLIQTNLSGSLRLTLTTDGNEPRFMVARLGMNGPILANAHMEGFRFFSSAARSVSVIETYEDGSQLIEERITVSRPQEGVRMGVSIVSAGVVFEDGTIQKNVVPSDFTLIDEYYMRMIRPTSVPSSNCHATRFYQDEVLLGTYEESDADKF